MTDHDPSDNRLHDAAVATAAVLEALEDPVVLEARDRAVDALLYFGGLLVHRGISTQRVLIQLIDCATAAFCHGAQIEDR